MLLQTEEPAKQAATVLKSSLQGFDNMVAWHHTAPLVGMYVQKCVHRGQHTRQGPCPCHHSAQRGVMAAMAAMAMGTVVSAMAAMAGFWLLFPCPMAHKMQIWLSPFGPRRALTRGIGGSRGTGVRAVQNGSRQTLTLK